MVRYKPPPAILTSGLALLLLALMVRDEWLAAHPRSSGLPTVIRWRAALASESQDAQRLIRSQLAAFGRGDYAQARSLQSEALHRRWSSDDAFRRLIESQYQEFTQCQDLAFGAARATGDGGVVQLPVRITGMNGHTVRAVYILIRENGRYCVESVLGAGGPPPDMT